MRKELLDSWVDEFVAAVRAKDVRRLLFLVQTIRNTEYDLAPREKPLIDILPTRLANKLDEFGIMYARQLLDVSAETLAKLRLTLLQQAHLVRLRLAPVRLIVNEEVGDACIRLGIVSCEEFARNFKMLTERFPSEYDRKQFQTALEQYELLSRRADELIVQGSG